MVCPKGKKSAGEQRIGRKCTSGFGLYPPKRSNRLLRRIAFQHKKLCQSPNPDLSEKIPCAYRIIELLAPVIENFPIKVDPAIGLESDNYPKTLQTVRNWFKNNNNYKIKKDKY